MTLKVSKGRKEPTQQTELSLDKAGIIVFFEGFTSGDTTKRADKSLLVEIPKKKKKKKKKKKGPINLYR